MLSCKSKIVVFNPQDSKNKLSHNKCVRYVMLHDRPSNPRPEIEEASIISFFILQGYEKITGKVMLLSSSVYRGQYAIPKINILCNLCCLKTRLGLLCNKSSTAQQPEPRVKTA